MKACIIYGMAEGDWQGRLLRARLRKAGFSITKDVWSADVIIAHSGGCYLLPDESRAQVVLLVGLPYWPGKHPIRSMPAKVRHELRNWWWYKKTFFNTFYFFARPRQWIRMWRNWQRRRLPHLNAAVTLIRNKHDFFMHPTDTKSLADEKQWDLQVIDGYHDDIWINPKPYVELVQKMLQS